MTGSAISQSMKLLFQARNPYSRWENGNKNANYKINNEKRKKICCRMIMSTVLSDRSIVAIQ